MKHSDSRGLKSARWLSNMELREDDLNFMNAAAYQNYTDLLATLLTEVTQVIQGLELTPYSLMTCTLSEGVAISFEGSYYNDDVWEFSASEGKAFVASVSSSSQVAFTVGGSNNRIDIVEIRPIRNPYNEVHRKFKDPITDLTTSAVMESRIEYGFEFQVISGIEATTPVAPELTPGWIKLAEVSISASATVITSADIKGVVDSASWTTDIESTVIVESGGSGGDAGITDLVSTTTASRVVHPLPKNILNAYSNALASSMYFTAGVWTYDGLVSNDNTGMFVGDIPLVKLITDSTLNPNILQSVTVTDNTECSASLIVRNGNLTTEVVHLYLTWVTDSYYTPININFETQAITMGSGSIKYTWLDFETVIFSVITGPYDTGFTSCEYRIEVDSSVAGNYFYVAGAQLVDNVQLFLPYTANTHLKDEEYIAINMPTQFTFDLIITPLFKYDTTIVHTLFSWDEYTSDLLQLIYNPVTDSFELEFDYSGNAQIMSSQTFSSTLSTHQKLRFIGSIDLSVAGTIGSRFIVIPLESGALNEDAVWSGTITPLTTELPYLSIGESISSDLQACAEYDYFKIFEGTLTGSILTSDGADALLLDTPILVDARSSTFKELDIEPETSISDALKQLAEDVKTGAAIQDNAINSRHMSSKGVGVRAFGLLATSSSILKYGTVAFSSTNLAYDLTSGKYTCPEAGLYIVGAGWWAASSGAAGGWISLVHEGSDFANADLITSIESQCVGLANCEKGDELWAKVDSGSLQISNSRFFATKIGEKI